MKKSSKILVILCYTYLISLMISSVHAHDNFLNNHDFEDGKTGWFFSGTSDVSTTTVYEGSYSGYLPNANDWIRQPVSGVWNPTVTNATYFKFYAIHDGSGTQTLNVIVDYADESFDVLDIDVTSTWQRFDIHGDVSHGLGVNDFRFQSPGGATVDFFVDFVTFGTGTEPQPSFPTPTPAGEILSEEFTNAAIVVATFFVFVNVILIVNLMSGQITTDQFTKLEIAIIFLAIFLLVFAGVVTNY